MVASALDGVLIGIAFVGFVRMAPQPASILCWSFFAARLTWGAVITWRRTGLPFATAAMAFGALLSACLAVLAATGRIFPDLPLRLWIPVGIGMALGPIFFWVESKKNPAKWQRWGRDMERKGVGDIFTARHIPQLRDGGL